MKKKRLLIGVTGASGAPLALELLQQLQCWTEVETHVMLSHCGELTLDHEAGMARRELVERCTCLYDNDDYGAGPASGSFETMGMVIIPCSMKTLAGVVSGYCDTLLLRAADVTLKERRRLVLVPRECPFGTIPSAEPDSGQRTGGGVIPASARLLQSPPNPSMM